ncbi:MAG: hypothetical protein KIC80_09830 [Brachyspira sp.]|nr:hypothetical protein [Brachyspira sp.]
MITLGIIGVVAAMTLPSVVNKYKQQEAIARMKKAYSILNQALRLSVAENGDFSEWTFDLKNSSADFVSKYWTPYFLAVGGVKNPGYSMANPFTSPNGKPIAFGAADGSGVTRTIFKFNDGSIVWILSGGANCEIVTDDEGNEHQVCDGWDFYNNPRAYVDINGIKGPNVAGKDFFCLDISTKSNTFIPFGHSISEEEVNKNCSKIGSGLYCLEKLMRDNWTIKDDYPW